jgi:hypothetical protein
LEQVTLDSQTGSPNFGLIEEFLSLGRKR